MATTLCVMQKTIDKYVGLLCEARKKKGLTEQQARDNLQDINVYGTLMVLAGDADGMVSGATTTTANTIRPALQVCMACYCFLKFHMACSQTDCPLFFLTSLCTFSAFVFWYFCMAAEVSHACNWPQTSPSSCYRCQSALACDGVVSRAISTKSHLNQNSPPGLSHCRFDSMVQHVLAALPALMETPVQSCSQ